MKLKIISTTDHKHEGEIFTHEGGINIGDIVQYKEVFINVVTIMWYSDDHVKLSSSNYSALFKIVG